MISIAACCHGAKLCAHAALAFQTQQHFSDSFHVSNGVRQGEYLVHLFAVYLDDLSKEIHNIKAGCYIGEVLLNHLIFADDICVFCSSVRCLQRIPDVCQTYAESHGIIFNCNKTVCMTFKAKRAKSTVTPLSALGGQYVSLLTNTNIWGLYWILSSQITKHSETAISILCSKQAAGLFFPVFKCN